MRFHYTQVFLLLWIVLFWSTYFLAYGRVEAKYERSLKEKYEAKAGWGPFFGLAFLGWTVVCLIYFFWFGFADWIWKPSLLNVMPVKVTGMVLMSLAYVLNLLFTVSVARSIREACARGEESRLITTGIYRRIRHPGYLAFFVAALGGFCVIPNAPTLALLLYTVVVVYGHTREEEKKLLKMYGQEYATYMQETGRYLPLRVFKQAR